MIKSTYADMSLQFQIGGANSVSVAFPEPIAAWMDFNSGGESLACLSNEGLVLKLQKGYKDGI